MEIVYDLDIACSFFNILWWYRVSYVGAYLKIIGNLIKQHFFECINYIKLFVTSLSNVPNSVRIQTKDYKISLYRRDLWLREIDSFRK